MRRRTVELHDVWCTLAEADAWLVSLVARTWAGKSLVQTSYGCSVEGNVERRVDHWLDGSKRRERTYVDGRLHGRCTAWYRNGKKRWVGEFKHGAQTGEWFYFRRDGKLDGRRTGVYENGLRFAAMKGFNDWNP